jgi:uncharacterized membrane protein
MRHLSALVLPFTLVLALIPAACDHHHEGGEPTGAQCPSGSTLTYQSFGKAFMDTYCVSCHDSQKSGAARKGAPAFHDFDTAEGVKRVAEHVDEYAASGPNATNEMMPEGNGPVPSLAERQMLGEWIACGAP